MSKPTHSSELLNVKGKNKNKAVENLIKQTEPKEQSKDMPFPLPTSSLGGSSDILSRVQAFLPQIKDANEKLEKADLSDLNIENVNEEQQYIEMNLGLGVYNVKKPGETTDTDDSEEEEELIIPNNNTKKTTTKPIIELMDQEE